MSKGTICECSSMKLHGKLRSVCDLSSAEHVDMCQIMHCHSDNVQQGKFEANLAEKQWVITLRSELDGKLRGVPTQMVLDATIADRTIKALFSGDTIIDRRYWGGSTLVQFGTHFDSIPRSRTGKCEDVISMVRQ